MERRRQMGSRIRARRSLARVETGFPDRGTGLAETSWPHENEVWQAKVLTPPSNN
jgi:hypothetical protein